MKKIAAMFVLTRPEQRLVILVALIVVIVLIGRRYLAERGQKHPAAAAEQIAR